MNKVAVDDGPDSKAKAVTGVSNALPKKGDKLKPAFVTRVQLFVSAEKLANLDRFDDSDPFCVMYYREIPPAINSSQE